MLQNLSNNCCSNATISFGDVNGDGINDVIFGDDNSGGENGSKGQLFVYFGHPTQAAITAGTYPNGPPTIWPSSETISQLTGGTAKGATPAFVQQNAAKTTAATNPVAFSSNTAQGDLIMVAFSYPSAATFSSVTDSLGSTFTQAGSTLTSTGSNKTRVYYANHIAGGADTVTVTFSGSTTSDVYITEYSGISTATAVDVHPGHNGAAGAATSNNGTTTVSGDIIYGFCFVDSAAGCAAGAGFTTRSAFDSNAVEDKMAGAAGAYAATGTAGGAYTMQMVALKPASPSYGFLVNGKSGNEGVTTVGDFNGATGDKGGPIEDVVMIGTVGSANAGIVFGQNSSYVWANPLNLNGIAAGQGVNITNAGDGYFGIVAAGDVTGDGIDDIVIGCGECVVSGQATAGSVNIFHGSASYWTAASGHNSLNMNTLTVGVNQQITGLWSYMRMGDNNSGGGLGIMTADVSGDGKKDLIIPGGYNGIENIKVIYNNDNNNVANSIWGINTTSSISNINGNNGFLFSVGEDNSLGGFNTGDLNGDGINEIIVGIPADSPNSVSNAGSTYIVWGANGGYPNSGQFDDSATYQGTTWIRLDGDYANEAAGTVVVTGDIDHDGKTDLAISAPGNSPNGVSGAGSIYVIWGGTGLSGEVTGGASTLETMVNGR